MNPENASLWDIPETASYLKISRDTLYRWIKTKQMPALRVGKKWLFSKADIDSWLHTAKGTEVR